jgi:Flp pilus assembly protein TadG
MKRKTQNWQVIKDDRGQALTEFAIVIPIILLFFLAMLQFFADFQASQLGNYAAFEAARVYAVDDPVDSGGSKNEALQAAALVLAPIARPAPDEIGGPTSVGSLITGLLSDVMGNSLVNYGVGYAMAKYVRLNSSVLGGSVNVAHSGGSPDQVNASINYPQPIFVPGLAGLWNLVMGDNVYVSMKDLRTGLTGIPSKILPVYEGAGSLGSLTSELSKFDPGAASTLSSLASSMPTVMLPYMNVQSKCSLGYENWQKYDGGPRKHANGDESDSSAEAGDPKADAAAQQVQQDQQDQDDYKNAIPPAKSACQNLCTADTNLANAHSKDDPIINNPKASDSDKANAQKDLNSAISAQQKASSANSQAQGTLNDAASKVQSDTGQEVPGVPCGCN